MNAHLKAVAGTIRVAGEDHPRAGTLITSTPPKDPFHSVILRIPRDPGQQPHLRPATFFPEGSTPTTSGTTVFANGKASSLSLARAIDPSGPSEDILAAIEALRERFIDDGALLFGSRALETLNHRLTILLTHPDSLVNRKAREFQARITSQGSKTPSEPSARKKVK
jgi:hypothetical protein